MDKDWRKAVRAERPDPVSREKAVSKEVSPCSEYTRYTAEGRLKDPTSDLSAIFDKEALGVLFRSGPFFKAKWSDRLGYGMAVIGEDTRIHLYQNGKYVIRRALDREHAENCFRVLMSMTHPAVHSSVSGSFLWEIVRDVSLDLVDPDFELIGPLLDWSEKGIVTEDVLNGITSRFREMDGRFGSIIDSIRSDEVQDVSAISDGTSGLITTYSEHLSSVLEGIEIDIPTTIGLGSYIVLVDSALRDHRP